MCHVTFPIGPFKYIVECDVSLHDIGVILMQEGMPISFETFHLKGKKLLNYEKEMLTILYAFIEWLPYLIGRHFNERM